MKHPRQRPWQFDIASLLAFTALAGVIFACGRHLGGSLTTTFAICGYFLALAVYLAFRLPVVWRAALGSESPWGRAQQRRRELEELANNQRQQRTARDV